MGFNGTTTSLALLFFVLVLPLTCSMKSTDQGIGESLRSEEEIRWVFEEWQVEHDKSYQNLGEEERRFQIFRNNLQFIEEHNRPENNHSYTLGLNIFADLSNEEYRSIYLSPLNMSGLLHTPRTYTQVPKDGQPLPSSVDWRASGAVSEIKLQGSCACCWAFTAVATVEGLNAIVTGNLITLSEQELVDCDTSNNGCKPSHTHLALKYIKTNGGIDTDANYPYQERVGVCDPNRNQEVTIDGYAWAPRSHEAGLAIRVAKQPVGVGIDAGGRDFQLYRKGVYTGHCTSIQNHAVTIIGYGAEGGMDFWLIKNSYGKGWGVGGYLKLERNAGGVGRCGVAEWPVYPIKTSVPKASQGSTFATHEGKIRSG